MLCRNKLLQAGLAGAGAAAVVVLCAGGYLLHKIVLKHRMHEFVQRQAMSQALYELGFDDDFMGYDSEDYPDVDYNDDDYFDNLMGLNQENQEAHT